MEEEKQIQRILVLGGSSFVGLQLLQELSKKYTQNNQSGEQYEIYYINRGKNYWNYAVQQIPNIKYINGNRSDKEEFGKLLHYVSRKLNITPQNKWKSVIDMCAYKWQNVKSVYDGLKSLINQYIFISTDSVYDVCKTSIRGPKYQKKKYTGKIEENQQQQMETEGQNSIFEGHKISEECAIRFSDPRDVKAAKEDEAYGHAKLMCEEYMENELDKNLFPYIILRFSDVIGPYDDSGRFWGYVKWICEINEQTAIPHDSETTQNLLSFVYSSDAINLMLKMIENSEQYHQLDSQQSPLFKAFNLACQEAVTLEEFLNEIYENVPIEQRACKNKLNIEKVGNAPAFYPSVECGPIDIQKAIKLLGFQPTPIKQVIKETTNFFTKVNKTYLYKTEEKYADSKLQRKIRKI